MDGPRDGWSKGHIGQGKYYPQTNIWGQIVMILSTPTPLQLLIGAEYDGNVTLRGITLHTRTDVAILNIYFTT
jgi:hypothetical protein